MNEIPTPAGAAPAAEKMPITAGDALKLWDAGEPVPAIAVTANWLQERVYTHAFEMIRYHLDHPGIWDHMREGTPEEPVDWAGWQGLKEGHQRLLIEGGQIPGEMLGPRERESAESIAFVAIRKGWAAMLAQHDHESIKPIFVQKPAADRKRNEAGSK
jgi:hypothetical protein